MYIQLIPNPLSLSHIYSFLLTPYNYHHLLVITLYEIWKFVFTAYYRHGGATNPPLLYPGKMMEEKAKKKPSSSSSSRSNFQPVI